MAQDIRNTLHIHEINPHHLAVYIAYGRFSLAKEAFQKARQELSQALDEAIAADQLENFNPDVLKIILDEGKTWCNVALP